MQKYILTGVAVAFGVAVPMTIPSSVTIGYAVALIGVLFLVWAILLDCRDRGWLNLSNISWGFSRYLLLSEAAELVYRQLKKDGEVSVDEDFAIAIGLEARVFGKRPTSNVLEEIDFTDLIQKGSLSDNGDIFTYIGEVNAAYIDLSVKRSDLNRVIRMLRAERKLG